MNEGIFKAMSDSTRRKIIELLKEGPKTAGEIANHFSHAQPTISRHLNVLKNANLIVAIYRWRHTNRGHDLRRPL